jgi:hypothetical protein
MHNRPACPLVPGLILAVAACGSGTEVPPPAGPTDTVPPAIVSLSPVPGDTGFALDSAIHVTFSEPVNHATIATASFFLQRNVTPQTVPLSYSYAGLTATAKPVSRLDSLTTYIATITRAVRDSAGNQLVADTTWEFTTRGGPVAAQRSGRSPRAARARRP